MKCAICGIEFEGIGNNPYPVRSGLKDRCCDDCDREFVIPMRIMNHHDDLEEVTYDDLNVLQLNDLIDRW